MKSRLALCLSATLLGLCSIGLSAKAHAQVDDEQTLVDSQGRVLTVRQVDTFLNGVAPLDRNRLTREWFHSVKASYSVSGADAENFSGAIELGYQVSFPWAMGVGLSFNYLTPNLAQWEWMGGTGLDGVHVYTPPLLPSGSISVNLGNGPGVQDVATVSVEVGGADGAVTVSNGHGTITGAAGGVLVRPYARLITAEGESVTTYGESWNMN